MYQNHQKLFAEFLGTFILVFCGTGAIAINEVSQGAVSHVGIAITFGLVVMAMIYSLGDVSGAHINPAVTLSFWIAKRFEGKMVLPYVLSQVLGALAASLLVKFLFPESATLGSTLPSGSDMQSFVLEVVLSFILMLVIFQVATGSKEKGLWAGIAIGFVVLFEAMFAGPICGASMNPARSLAPALVSGNLSSLWVYLTATTLGMLLAVPTHHFLKAKAFHEKATDS